MNIRALVVAVENYPLRSKVAGLAGVVDGANKFLDTLVQHVGLEETNILFCSSLKTPRQTHNATRKGILEAVKKLLLKADETEKLFIYIAGHGISTIVPSYSSTAPADLLLCSNFESDNGPSATICIDELLSLLSERLGAGDHYSFVDICRTAYDVGSAPLGLERSLAKTGVANQLRLSAAKPGDSTNNDREFLNTILTGLAGRGSADPDDQNSHTYWVTFASLRRDVEERMASLQRSCEIRAVGSGKFQISELPAGREVATIRQIDNLKVPPVKLLTYYDQVFFLGETNSQLAGIPRDPQWNVIKDKKNFLQQALEQRGGKRWKKLEIYMLERLETAGRPSQSLQQLLQERAESEQFLMDHAAELTEELILYRYDYPGFYGSVWLADNGKRHVHMSQRVSGQDIRYAPANDYIDFQGDRLPRVDHCLSTLNTVRSLPSTVCHYHYRQDAGTLVAPPSSAASGIVARAPTADKQAQDEQPASSSNTEHSFLSLRDLADRANRSLRYSSVAELVSRRRAIVGPKNIAQLTADAEHARQLLIAGELPTPIEMAALEQAIRLQRPAPACVRDGMTMLPLEGNWIADLWLHFQVQLKQLQVSVARLDRIDSPSRDEAYRTALGTGFLVGENLLLTAAHVVTALSHGTGILQTGQAEAEFEGYLNVGKKNVFPVLEVLKYDTKLDLALLKLTGCNIQAVTIEPISRPVPGFPICVIGYPQDDPRNSAALMDIIFAGKFDVKRAAIGEVLTCSQGRFTHDCSTLGGASGGPVIDINTGKLCGVHVAGQSLVHNEAVDARCLLEFLKPTKPAIKNVIPISSLTSAPFPTLIPLERPKMKKPTKNAASFLEKLKAMDPTAYSEVVQTQESVPGQPTMSQETVVLLKGRPVLDIKDGKAVLELNQIDSQVWKQRLEASPKLLEPHIRAVGRIELLNQVGGTPFVGTGWLLRDNIIVTNRHVANLFARRDGAKLVFAPGLDGTPMRTVIDFLEEFGSTAAAEFPLFEIVHIEDPSGPDIAFLRVEPMNGQPLPPAVSLDGGTPDVGEQIVVIGYPARDPNFPQPAEMDRIFGHRYDKKRLAPGMVTKSNSTEFLHDCSTLGGNSGSEIVSLKTGKAVALHFAGTLFTANHAVPINIVAEKLDKAVPRTSLTPSKSSNPPVVNPTPKVVQIKEDPQTQSVAMTGTTRVVEATIPIHIRIEIGPQ